MIHWKSRAALAAPALCLALVALLGACDDGDVECPEGFSKSGKLCLQADGGEPVVVGDRRDAALGPIDQVIDASTGTPMDDSGLADASSSPAMDAATGSDAQTQDAQSELDASATTDSASATPDSSTPAPECDATHACSSTGYSCVNNKCVSACAQTQCDANATCGLVRGAPVCSCNRGYLPSSSGGRVTCVRDVACAELDCDENATCEMSPNQPRRCVCKTEFTGDGKTCTRVACPALSTIRIENGRATTSDGTTTVGKVATVRCNDGFRATAGGPLVCDETGKWTGTLTECSPITCAKPTATVEHATLTMPERASYRPNERAIYACEAGYKPRGEPAITCRNDGTWPAPTLMCIKACGDGMLDGAPYNEECDPRANGGSAWTCGNDCKPCVGFCQIECSGSGTSCPAAPWGSSLTTRCATSNRCALSCTTYSRCPEGTECTGGVGQMFCTLRPTAAAGLED